MKRVLVILLVFACIGCDDVRLPQPLTQLVVEGWVEDGGRPVVMLTTAVPVSDGARSRFQMVKMRPS